MPSLACPAYKRSVDQASGNTVWSDVIQEAEGPNFNFRQGSFNRIDFSPSRQRFDSRAVDAECMHCMHFPVSELCGRILETKPFRLLALQQEPWPDLFRAGPLVRCSTDLPVRSSAGLSQAQSAASVQQGSHLLSECRI